MNIQVGQVSFPVNLLQKKKKPKMMFSKKLHVVIKAMKK